MIKYFCDHCGEEITGQRNNVECTIYPSAGSRIIHRGELCEKCNDRLGRFLTCAEGLEEEGLEEEAQKSE